MECRSGDAAGGDWGGGGGGGGGGGNFVCVFTVLGLGPIVIIYNCNHRNQILK